MSFTGYYSQIHFKLNELELYYNLPVAPEIRAEDNLQQCPHVPKLLCSRAHELAPDKCISERKCEIYFNREQLFSELGIHAPTLKQMDEDLRRS